MHKSHHDYPNNTHVQDCSDFCLKPDDFVEIDQGFQYYGYIPHFKLEGVGKCWCSNTPPAFPRPMKDCETPIDPHASRIYSALNMSKICYTVTFCYYMTLNSSKCSEQWCDYKIIQEWWNDGTDHVRQIRSNNTMEYPNEFDYIGYRRDQQCWANFKCPDDMYAYWSFVVFDTNHPVIFHAVNSGSSREYVGDIGGSNSWFTLYDNEITFEFKARGSPYRNRGFDILLKCISKEF